MGAISDYVNNNGNSKNIGLQVEQIIQHYCGWHIAPIREETITVDIVRRSDLAFLPTLAIRELIKVENRCLCSWETLDICNIEHSGITYSNDGVIQNKCVPFCEGLGSLRVTLKHGFNIEEIQDLLSVADALKTRLENDSNIRSQSVNGASVSYFGTDEGYGRGAGLLESEKNILAKYKVRGDIVG